MAQRVTKWISDLDGTEHNSKKEATAYDEFLVAKSEYEPITLTEPVGYPGALPVTSVDEFVAYVQDVDRRANVKAIIAYVEKTK